MDYLTLKWIHIISSTILFGTGIGTAFFMFMSNREKSLNAIVYATKTTVIADLIFTTPAIIIQFISSLYLAKLGAIPLNSKWILWGIVLYFFTGACWLPVVWMQVKMRDLAHIAAQNKSNLTRQYWQFERAWVILGMIAFPAVLLIFWLMVAKPN